MIVESNQIVTVFKESLKHSTAMLDKIQIENKFLAQEMQIVYVQHRQALEKRKTELNKNLDSIQLIIQQKTLQKQISDIKSDISLIRQSIESTKF